MSADTLGSYLLEESKEEGLDELLRSLWQLETSSSFSLGFQPLDKLLNAFQDPPMTRQQQQVHTQWSTQNRLRQPPKGKTPPVVEIAGATACSGKTQLLYHLVSLSLLPPKIHDVALGGKSHAVVLFDLSSRFSVLRLNDLMYSHVSSNYSTSAGALPDQEISSLILDSLIHLHIFRPQSSSSLLAALGSLSAYLLAQPPNHLSANRPLGLLAINELSAFLWQDRLDGDEDASFSMTNAGERANSGVFLYRYRAVVSSLRHIQQSFSCTIVATNWGLAPVSSMTGQPALRPHLPSVWNNFCTVKLVVERDRISKFGPGMSVEEARREGSQRWEAVEKSGFSVWINWACSDGWREEVREGVRGLERGGGYSFRVNRNGLLIGNDEN